MGLGYRMGETNVTNGNCLNPDGRHAHVSRRPFRGDEPSLAVVADHSVLASGLQRPVKKDGCPRPFDIEPTAVGRSPYGISTHSVSEGLR